MKARKPVLLLGEEEIGTLEVTGNDMPWTYGAFSPLPGFARVAPLFELAEEALRAEDESSELHWDLLEQINRLDLAVRHSNGVIERIDDFKIEEGRFEYKASAGAAPVDEVTRVIGAEHDTSLQERLRTWTLGQGGAITERSYVVAGSQEVLVCSIALSQGTLEAVFETFMALRGRADLVARVEAVLRGA